MLLFADAVELLAWCHGDELSQLLFSATEGEALLAIQSIADVAEVRIWTSKRRIRLSLPNGHILAELPHHSTLSLANPAPDGPFVITLAATGGYTLSRISDDPIAYAGALFGSALPGSLLPASIAPFSPTLAAIPGVFTRVFPGLIILAIIGFIISRWHTPKTSL